MKQPRKKLQQSRSVANSQAKKLPATLTAFRPLYPEKTITIINNTATTRLFTVSAFIPGLSNTLPGRRSDLSNEKNLMPNERWVFAPLSPFPLIRFLPPGTSFLISTRHNGRNCVELAQRGATVYATSLVLV